MNWFSGRGLEAVSAGLVGMTRACPLRRLRELLTAPALIKALRDEVAYLVRRLTEQERSACALRDDLTKQEKSACALRDDLTKQERSACALRDDLTKLVEARLHDVPLMRFLKAEAEAEAVRLRIIDSREAGANSPSVGEDHRWKAAWAHRRETVLAFEPEVEDPFEPEVEDPCPGGDQ